MIQFHETINGRRFYERYVPQITNALNTIAHELKRANDINEGKHLKWIADDVADVEPAMARLLRYYADER